MAECAAPFRPACAGDRASRGRWKANRAPSYLPWDQARLEGWVAGRNAPAETGLAGARFDVDRTSQIGLTHDRTRERGSARVQAAVVGLVAPMAGARARLAPPVLHGPGARRSLSSDDVRRQPYAVRDTGCASHPV